MREEKPIISKNAIKFLYIIKKSLKYPNKY